MYKELTVFWREDEIARGGGVETPANRLSG